MALITDKNPRPQRDAERTRAEILQAALEEFASRGFDGATVRNIAARIKTSHAMIRYYYETKEKLWFEAVAYLFQRQDEELRLTNAELEALENGDLSVFRRFLRLYVYYCAEHPEHARIMMQETVSPTDRMRIALQTHLKGPHKGFGETLERLKQLGVFPKSAPIPSIMYMITGACQNLFALAPEAKVTLNYDALRPEAIEAHAQLIISMFCPETAETNT